MQRPVKHLVAVLPVLVLLSCSSDDGSDAAPSEVRLETEEDSLLHTYAPGEYLKYKGTLTFQDDVYEVAAERRFSTKSVNNAFIGADLMVADDSLQVLAQSTDTNTSASYFLQNEMGSFEIYGAQVQGVDYWYAYNGEAPTILPSPMVTGAAGDLIIDVYNSDNVMLDSGYRYAYEVRSPQLVETALGVFEAFPVVTKRGDEPEVTSWYYPPLGKIKTVEQWSYEGAVGQLEYSLVETNIPY